MTTELQAHSKALQDQTVSTARDISILNDKDHEYAKQGQAKTKEVNVSSSRDGMRGRAAGTSRIEKCRIGIRDSNLTNRRHA